MGAGEILETFVDLRGEQYRKASLASFPPELRPAIAPISGDEDGQQVGSSGIDALLERESYCELQYAWKTAWANFLEGSEITWPRVGHQIARLIERCAITAVGADGVVLQLVDPVAILHVVVRVVEQIERLHLKLEFLAFLDRETAGQSCVNPLQPRAVERIQADSRSGATAIDSRRAVRGVLVKGAVVQISIGAVTIRE